MKPIRSLIALMILIEDKKNKITFYQKAGDQDQVVERNAILGTQLGTLKHMILYNMLSYTEEKIKKTLKKKES